MLVLSRKQGESIVIDGGIRLTVIEVRGSVVRLGIEAPKHIRVLRNELEERRRNQEPATLDWPQRLEWPQGLDCSSASTPGQLVP
jgi:carbon storage regulator